ncbi:MAG: hypothetical protein KUG77_22880 [Nannocystaceae bacterium]|nr:hypothetical protein [Nannocystaceae bacterium]
MTVATSLTVAPATPEAPASLPPADSLEASADEVAEASNTPDTDGAIVAAEEAWNRGDFLEVRGLLEPIADNDPLDDRVEREKVLVLLADATLSDSTLPSDERQVRVTGHLSRLMDANRQWRLPRKVYSPELYDLYLDVRERRLADAGSQCEADKLACEADADAVGAELSDTQQALDNLQKQYDSQEVEIGEKRSRVLALIPLGISHFFNGDRAIGATFIVAEAGFGIAGLSLLAVRATVDGCDRKRNFQSGSLVCNPRGGVTKNDVVRRRKAEETMAWLFVGTVVLDILIAQLRFKEFEFTDSVPRSELEGYEKRRGRRGRKRRATVRPTTGASRKGASMGLRVDF